MFQFFLKMQSVSLCIKASEGYEDVVREYYKHHGHQCCGDAGIDLFCVEDIIIPARAISHKIPLGICVEAYRELTVSSQDKHRLQYINECLFVLPRSSTGFKTPIRLSNSIGVIDAGYRGMLIAICDNLSDEPFVMKKGQRYFQIIHPSCKPLKIKLVDKLSETVRGVMGFGSTGK
jgi:dUTP pyrophosphatase